MKHSAAQYQSCSFLHLLLMKKTAGVQNSRIEWTFKPGLIFSGCQSRLTGLLGSMMFWIADSPISPTDVGQITRKMSLVIFLANVTEHAVMDCRPRDGVKGQLAAGTRDLTAAAQWTTADKHQVSATVRWPLPGQGKPVKPQCQLTGTWKF